MNTIKYPDIVANDDIINSYGDNYISIIEYGVKLLKENLPKIGYDKKESLNIQAVFIEECVKAQKISFPIALIMGEYFEII